MNPAVAYIVQKEEPYRSIMLHLQLLIEHSLPGIEMRYKWKLPFFYLEGKPLCYLNQTRGYVDLGLWKAPEYRIHREKMVSDGRKLIWSLRYRSLEEIDDIVVTDLLREAAWWRRGRLQ